MRRPCSPAVMRFSCSTFPGASAWIWGAPGFRASSGSLTAGSGSQSTTTSAAASTAAASVVAITAATASPTWRTRSIAKRVVLAADRRLARAALGRRLVDGHGPAVRLEVGAGHHRDDAGAAERGGGVDPPDPRVRVRAPDEDHVA